ncbi:outer membrane protein assembly factor BamE [Candidatus Pelagibacter sp.]|nr:outer membrane protein assembly factor BamE [Candidatus Pelagibacter sp.]
MKNFYLIFIFIFILNCSFNKVVKHHGVHFLEKKHQKLTINKTNKNDVLKLLGRPSTKSTFDNDVWIYIERKISTGKLHYLGKEKLLVNNVLVLELNNVGLLSSKKLYKKNDMNNLKFSEISTDAVYRKRSFVYDFLSSMRQKINDPLNKRKLK